MHRQLLNTGWCDVTGCIRVYFIPWLTVNSSMTSLTVNSTLDCNLADLLTSVTVYSLPKFDLDFDLWVEKTLWHHLDRTFNQSLWPWLWPVWAGLENPWPHFDCIVSARYLPYYKYHTEFEFDRGGSHKLYHILEYMI